MDLKDDHDIWNIREPMYCNYKYMLREFVHMQFLEVQQTIFEGIQSEKEMKKYIKNFQNRKEFTDLP